MRSGTLLFSEGDQGSVAYVVKRGRIEIFLDRQPDLSLAIREAGEIVGEMALIDLGTRSASARALEDCELAVITEEQVSHRIGRTDPILRMCLNVVLQRYRETVAMLDNGSAIRPEPRPPAAPKRDCEALKALSLEHEIRRAILRNEFELYFQPIVSLSDRVLAGFETLIRWNHPARGLVGPVEFIPAAEASGLISDVTAWCLAEVGRRFPTIVAASLEAGLTAPLFLSVNISGHDLTEAGFLTTVSSMLDASGLPASSIKLEITESVLMREPIKAAATLAECRALGLKVAIDDFGTGYSSLSHLSTLPITTIKIDQSFVRSMVADPTSRRIIHMILRLAHDLDIPVVAEGIEGETEASELAALGCALGQGYLFGRPQPLARTLDFVRDGPSRHVNLPTVRPPIVGLGLIMQRRAEP